MLMYIEIHIYRPAICEITHQSAFPSLKRKFRRPNSLESYVPRHKHLAASNTRDMSTLLLRSIIHVMLYRPCNVLLDDHLPAVIAANAVRILLDVTVLVLVCIALIAGNLPLTRHGSLIGLHRGVVVGGAGVVRDSAAVASGALAAGRRLHVGHGVATTGALVAADTILALVKGAIVRGQARDEVP